MIDGMKRGFVCLLLMERVSESEREIERERES